MRPLATEAEANCQYCHTRFSVQEAQKQYEILIGGQFGGVLILAESARASGNWKSAKAHYDAIIQKSVDHPDAWLYRGLCIIQKRDNGDQKFFFNCAIDSITREAIDSWRRSVQFAKHPQEMGRRVAAEINEAFLVCVCELEREGHVDALCLCAAQVLLFALEFDPESTAVATTGVKLCELPSRWNVDWDLGRAQSNDPTLQAIWEGLRGARSKFQQVLVKADPSLSERLRERARQDELRRQNLSQNELAKVKAEDSAAKQAVGCLIFVCVILLVISVIALKKALNGPDNGNVGPLALLGVLVFGVAIVKLFIAMQSPSESKKALSDLGERVAMGGALLGEAINHEMNRKEREKPITKGDIEDLKREIRRDRH